MDDVLVRPCRDAPVGNGQRILNIALKQSISVRMADRITQRMKIEPGGDSQRPLSRLVGLADPDHLIFSDMPRAPPEDEEDEDMSSPMALAVGITDDADILPDATAEESLHGDGHVPSATAGAIEPPAFLEEAVDFGSPSKG